MADDSMSFVSSVSSVSSSCPPCRGHPSADDNQQAQVQVAQVQVVQLERSEGTSGSVNNVPTAIDGINDPASDNVNDPAVSAIFKASLNFRVWSSPGEIEKSPAGFTKHDTVISGNRQSTSEPTSEIHLASSSSQPQLSPSLRRYESISATSDHDEGLDTVASGSRPTHLNQWFDHDNSHLPSFVPFSSDESATIWTEERDSVDGISVVHSINAAYGEIVHWRQNLFTVPYGPAGKAFVAELTRLLRAFTEHSSLEGIALKAAMVLPALVLQRPHSSSRAKEHVDCLTRRLRAWRLGRIDELMREGRTIQNSSRPKCNPGSDKDHFHRTFSNLVFAGKIHAAMRLLSEYVANTTGKGILDLNAPEAPGSSTTVREVLIAKHPTAAEVFPDALIGDPSSEPVEVHPVYFDRLTGAAIRQAALRTRGAAGPSGMNADNWRRICTAFKTNSTDLCEALAALARRLCCEMVDPMTISALLACRLIPLDKNPGVRPIGVCEVARRIIGKAVLSIVNPEVQRAAGSLQLCAGQPCGIEAAIHAMRTVYEDSETDGILMVDARNAFNSLNRGAALRNIRWTCPEIATILINIYRCPAELFTGGEVLLSEEGTTQGDPLAMAMYGLAVVPLIRKLAGKAKQAWFADDATGGGKLYQLKWWWDRLNECGPAFGYVPNPVKTWLLVKDSELANAKELFAETGVQITTEGRRLLGAPVGTTKFCEFYVESAVTSWRQELEVLATVARTQPHAAFAAFAHGFVGKWTFLSRTTDATAPLFQPLEETIRCKFIPGLTSRSTPGDAIRELLALPPRLGGLGVINPASSLAQEYGRSKKICAPLTSLILEQKMALDRAGELVAHNRSQTTRLRQKALEQSAGDLRSSLPVDLQRTMEVFSDKGASHWLCVLPVSCHGFALPKAAFRDALCLRYNWVPDHLPAQCSCGQPFSIDHALSCTSGGYSILRHNEIRDLTASLLEQVCQDVTLEPPLQPLSGEQLSSTNLAPEARLDVHARGFWGNHRFSRTFFDVRVFHPNAPSARTSSLASQYRKHERCKRRQYDQRVREVEGGSFVPLIFSTAGGMGPACSTTYKRLASMLAEKNNLPYSSMMNWLRCRLSFALLRSALTSLRGSRRRLPVLHCQPVLALAEGHLSLA